MSLNNTGLISIIIPVYNRPHLIGVTLESIMAQTYGNWECIVVDDGSTDNTKEVVNTYCEKDTRIRLYDRPSYMSGGGNAARNYGFELSKGEFINWFDSDDLMVETKLEFMMDEFIKNPDIDFCLSHSKTFEEDNLLEDLRFLNITVSDNLFEDYVLKKTPIPTIVPIFKKEFLKDKKLFNVNTLRGQEFELFSTLFYQYKKKYGFVNQSLVRIRTSKKGAITSSYFSGDSNKFKSYFLVLRKVLSKIQTKKAYYRFLKYYYKELLIAVRLKHYLVVYKELLFIYKHTYDNSIKSKLEIVFDFIYIFLIQLSGGKLYYRLKKKIYSGFIKYDLNV